MSTVNRILATKGSTVWSVQPDAPVFEALELMAEKGIGALLVIDEGEIAGIMSERDYARKVILLGKSSKSTPVSEIMTTNVLFVEPSTSINACLALMTAKRIRHLPVLDDGELAGMISIGDVVSDIISEKQFMITQLENYIKGYG